MITELKKSINAILFERVTSPLFGTIITSWIIWNWKIIYLTLFISESKITGNKIDYIVENYNDINLLITYPLISTLLLLTIIPFVSNGAFWLNLKFKKWRVDEKNNIEKTQLLSIEQSVQLRKEIRGKESEFEKILEKRELEEKILKTQITELEKRLDNEKTIDKSKSNKIELNNSESYQDFTKFSQNKILFDSFEEISSSIRNNSAFPKNISKDLREYYYINGLIEDDFDSNSGHYSRFTERGNDFYRYYFNQKFEKTK